MTNRTRALVYGRTTAADRGSIRNLKAEWDEIVELFREPVRRPITSATYAASSPKARAHSKNTGLFFGGKCADGHRGDNTLEYRSIVNLDLDENCAHIWEEFELLGDVPELSGLSYLLHTTRSHTGAAPKMRILVPLARDVEPAEYEPVARALAQMIDPSMKAVARESFTPAQGMYFPSVSSDQDYHFASFDGRWFDPDAALKKYPADDASKWPKREKETVTEYVAGRKMTHPEEKKALAPIITAVHRAFDPYHFIEEFLSDVYIASGDRYFPVGATGAPSVRIYDDAFIHSDHGSDPAVGQHNTFDLGRIHLFGHLDDDYDTGNLSPGDWPSYKAMVEFMMEREDVREQLALVEDEVSTERNAAMYDLLDDLDDDLDDDDDEPSVSDDDDLLGLLEDLEPEEKPDKAALTIEDVLKKVRRSIEKAKSLDDLERRLEIIRGFPTSDFRDLHRDLVSADIQKRFVELSGEKITKATARKMLAPTIEDLRSQVEGEPLPTWLKDWVYVAGENKFLNLETKTLIPREGFDGLLAVQAGERFGVGNTGVSIVPPSVAALSVFDVAKPLRTTYHPGKPVLFEDNGVLLANTYRSPVVPSGGYKGSEGVKLLTRLLRDLFPEREHREIVMDFLAHCVRYPERKLKYALLIKGQENEGKTLLAMLLSKLIGQSNYGIIGSDQLKEKFNGWSHEKLLCVVEEIKIPGREAYEVLNKIKPVITNLEVPIRKMQKDVSTELNFCNIFLTTNHEDCLPLEEDNSRFTVLFTRFRTNQEVKDWHAKLLAEEGRVYTRDLWDHIQERPAQFLDALARYKFSDHYDPEGRAPDTVFKAIMAEDSKGDERQLLEALLESEEDPTITSDILIWNSFRDLLDERGLAPNLRNRAVSGFLKPLGFVRAKPINVQTESGRTKRSIWTRNTSLLGPDYSLTDAGMRIANTAIKSKLDMDEEDFGSDNVVQFPGKS